MQTKLRKILVKVSKFCIYGIILQASIYSLVFATNSNAQRKSIEEIQADFELRNWRLERVFSVIEKNMGFHFAYVEENLKLENKSIYLKPEDNSLGDVLRTISEQTGLSFKRIDETILVRKNADQQNAVEEVINVQQSVFGRITDENGEALPGASVLEKGTTNGTITDVDGKFSLNTTDNAVLTISFVGYETIEVPLNGRSVIDVHLTSDISSLEEVVVVGYGTTKKKDLTGAVGSIKSEEIQQVVSSSFENALAGRIAGVQVGTKEGAPGSGLSIKIRGGTSINASNAPLYVIDGYPVIGENESLGGRGMTTQSPLVTLNPADIESIEVLKDASSTAIYGSRGANGVILITTRSGKNNQKPKFTFDSYVGVQELPKQLDVLTGAEFAAMISEVYPTTDSLYYDNNGNIITGPSQNWQDEVYRQALVQSYQMSVTGGNASSNYTISGGYFDQQGIIENTSFKRYSANLKLNTEVNEKLRFGTNVNVGYTTNDGTSTSNNGVFARSGGASFYALYYRPIFPFDREDGLQSVEDANNVNPTKLISDEVLQLNNTIRVLGNIYGEYNILEGLKLKVSVGGTSSSTDVRQYYPGNFGIGSIAGGAVAEVLQQQSLNWLNENTLSYNKDIGSNHHLNFVAGYTVQSHRFQSVRNKVIGFPIETTDNVYNLGAGSLPTPPVSSRTEWGLKSFLGRANYSLMDRYLFTFTFRSDGSSRFAEGHKWGYFPSGAVAWRLSDEPFFQGVPAVNNLKLRASYGLTGNQEIGLYQSLSALSLANYNFNNVLATGFAPNRIANPDLSWETTKQADAGLEVGLFESRIMLELDYYRKITSDLLLNVPVPYTSGYSSSLQNLGSIENKGFEINLSTVNIERPNGFQWTTNFNISFNDNKVISLGDEADEFFVDGADWSIKSDFVIREGERVGSIIGYKLDGVFQTEDFTDNGSGGLILNSGIPIFTGSNPKPGDVKYLDTNGDGIVNVDDRQILGSAQPKHYGGISNNFTYKGFDLKVFLQWSYGNEVYNSTRYRGFSNDNFSNKLAEMNDRWTPENPSNTYWSFFGGPPSGILTDFFIEDGSFLRVSNVTVGYTLPGNLLNRMKLSQARFYLSGDNLLLFTKYKGYDPDVSVSNNPLTPGIDFDAYPKSRVFRLGVNLSF